MKICTKCKKEKTLEEFIKLRTSKDGFTWDCKECRREVDRLNYQKYKDKSKKYYQDNKEKCKKQSSEWAKNNKERTNELNRKWYANLDLDKKKQLYRKKVEWNKNKAEGVYSVYLLPISNYVGITKNVYQRMCYHRGAQKRDTTGYIILAQFKDKQDALYLERDYHIKGYAGAHPFVKY
jgi:hypothetical protein